ncbi:hypothetical protein B0I73DRAFT_166404 [Yarrowia lipolytica]|nr:hypothetical protein B0I73DRAFT_166404 [Yarrowia lipolytica]
MIQKRRFIVCDVENTSAPLKRQIEWLQRVLRSQGGFLRVADLASDIHHAAPQIGHKDFFETGSAKTGNSGRLLATESIPQSSFCTAESPFGGTMGLIMTDNLGTSVYGVEQGRLESIHRQEMIEAILEVAFDSSNGCGTPHVLVLTPDNTRVVQYGECLNLTDKLKRLKQLVADLPEEATLEPGDLSESDSSVTTDLGSYSDDDISDGYDSEQTSTSPRLPHNLFESALQYEEKTYAPVQSMVIPPRIQRATHTKWTEVKIVDTNFCESRAQKRAKEERQQGKEVWVTSWVRKRQRHLCQELNKEEERERKRLKLADEKSSEPPRFPAAMMPAKNLTVSDAAHSNTAVNRAPVPLRARIGKSMRELRIESFKSRVTEAQRALDRAEKGLDSIRTVRNWGKRYKIQLNKKAKQSQCVKPNQSRAANLRARQPMLKQEKKKKNKAREKGVAIKLEVFDLEVKQEALIKLE